MSATEGSHPAHLLGFFFEESLEGLDAIENGLLRLDEGGSPDAVHEVFRAMHSIKGAAGTFGFQAVSDFAHDAETLLDELRTGARPPTRDCIDLLLQAADVLRGMIEALQEGREPSGRAAAEVEAQLRALVGAAAPAEAAPQGAPSQAAPTADVWLIVFRPHPNLFATGNDPGRLLRELEDHGELEVELDESALPDLDALDPEACYLAWTLRLHGGVARDAVEEVFAWVEDDCDLTIAPDADAPVEADADAPLEANADAPVEADARETSEAAPDAPRTAQSSDSIRVATEKIDALINLVGEIVITQSMLGAVETGDGPERVERLRDGLGQLARNTRELQEGVMRIRMLPMSAAFSRFPRLVRDLSGKLGKQVELVVSGEDVELDKTVLEKIGDPLVHLVRNALDHGIEPPEARREAGKPETARLELAAAHRGGTIVIEVRDDGRGLDRERILAKARQRGLVSGDESLTEDEVFDLVFRPGFSTADRVSDVSGRGVGMDVVRRNIQSLGGSVGVASKAGAGSTFSIRLPLTLAVLDGQLVDVGGETFVIALESIVESQVLDRGRMSTIAGDGEVYRFRESVIPLARLDRLFALQAEATEAPMHMLVIVESGSGPIGLVVDALGRQQQVVVKSLEENYVPLAGISGATILGDGSVALIVDLAGIGRLASEERASWGTAP